MPLGQPVERVGARVEAGPSRYAYADNLKVLLVIGVIVGHATMAWTNNDAWVLEEPPVREPLPFRPSDTITARTAANADVAR